MIPSNEVAIQIVIQFGGTEDEQYLHTFGSKSAAESFIRSANKAGYECLGPFNLELPGVAELSAAATEVMKLLRELGVTSSDKARKLDEALDQMKSLCDTIYSSKACALAIEAN